jgi:hypothetical protein
MSGNGDSRSVTRPPPARPGRELIRLANRRVKPLFTIRAITREAPLASLFVALLFGVAVARRR